MTSIRDWLVIIAILTAFLLTVALLLVHRHRSQQAEKADFERRYLDDLKRVVLRQLQEDAKDHPDRFWTAREIWGLSNIADLLDTQVALDQLTAEVRIRAVRNAAGDAIYAAMAPAEANVAGNRYPGLGVGVIVIDEQTRRVLIHLRGAEVRNEPGLWDFPGGGVDWSPDELDAHAALARGDDLLAITAMREVKEVHDIKIKILAQLATYSHYAPPEDQFWVSITFVAQIIKGEPRIMEPHKCDKVAWVTLADLAGMLADGRLAGVTRQIVNDLLNHPERFPFTLA